MTLRHSRRRRQGVTRGDVVVLLLLIGATAMLVLMGVSRARESARLAGCSRNLSQIGFALALYDQMHGHLPEIATPIPPSLPPAEGPPDRSRCCWRRWTSPTSPSCETPRRGRKPNPGRFRARFRCGASSVRAIRMPWRDDCGLPSVTGP